MIKDAYNQLLQKLTPGFSELGFAASGEEEFSRVQGEAFQRLTTSLREVPKERVGFVEVFPGFNYSAVESLAAELRDKKARPGFVTCSLNIGLLMSKGANIEWRLSSDRDVEQLLPIILGAVREYGIPFWDTYSTLKKLLARFEAKDPLVCRGDWLWRLAATYCLLGHPTQAVRLLEEKAAAMPAQKARLHTSIQKIQARFRN